MQLQELHGDFGLGKSDGAGSQPLTHSELIPSAGQIPAERTDVTRRKHSITSCSQLRKSINEGRIKISYSTF